MGAINVIATILNLRTPGMTIMKMREKDAEGARALDRRSRRLFPLAYVTGILAMALIYAE